MTTAERIGGWAIVLALPEWGSIQGLCCFFRCQYVCLLPFKRLLPLVFKRGKETNGIEGCKVAVGKGPPRQLKMTAVAEELARLTGLDVPTVSEQVLPHLDSYSAPEPLRLYLEVCSCP